MQQEEYDQMTKELEPFREQVTLDGETKRIITAHSQWRWLESKGIISFGKGIYNKSPAIIYPKDMHPKDVSQRYLKYEDMLSNYMSATILDNVGKMGVKKVMLTVKEDLPF